MFVPELRQSSCIFGNMTPKKNSDIRDTFELITNCNTIIHTIYYKLNASCILIINTN